jgi:hypothetical protein
MISILDDEKEEKSEDELSQEELRSLAETLNKALKLLNSGTIRWQGALEIATSLETISLESLNIEEAGIYCFGITDPIGQIAAWIYDRLKEVSSWFASVVDTLLSPIKSGLGWLSDRFSSVYRYLSEDLPKFFSGLWDFLATIGGRLSDFFKALWEGAQLIGTTVVTGIANLGASLAEFADHVKAFGAQVMGGLSSIGGAITGFFDWFQKLPDIIGSMFKTVIDFFSGVGESFSKFVSNPGQWFQDNIISPIWNGLVWLGGQISAGAGVFFNAIMTGLKTIGDVLSGALKTLGSWMLSALAGIGEWIYETVMSVTKPLQPIGTAMQKVIADQFLAIADLIPQVTDMTIKPLTERMYGMLGISTIPELSIANYVRAWIMAFELSVWLFLMPVLYSMSLRAIAFMVRGLGISTSRGTLVKEIHLKFLGAGGVIKFDIMKWIGGHIFNLGEEISKIADKLVESLWLGIGIWFTRYLSVFYTFYLRNYIPIRFPTIAETNAAWLRSRVAEIIPEDLGKSSKDIQEAYLYYLRLRGYSDFLIRWQFADPEEFYSTLIDRFGIERKLPLSGVWRTPSVSDVARMWVRDVLRPPEMKVEDMIRNLSKAYEVAGLYRDVGMLYTLLAFRYPPPSDLGEFYWRGMAKSLWLDETLEEEEWKKMFSITWEATSPYEINNLKDRASLLNRMISIYMKWHDLFPAPWAPDFPTDKSIMVELMADLPTRIDLRWMARWGLFQHLADAKIDPMADLKSIYESFTKLKGDETVRETVTPEITLDGRLLSRLLIARRMNPLVAPLVSVAQIHAILAPEMTLLRAGFIDSLRRGFITLDLSEKLMSGLIKINFLTGYIDPTTGEYKEINYPKPVFWLTAERRLLQMRSMFDRYNYIMRDLITRSVYGIVWIAITPEEAVEIIKEFHSVISENIRSNIKLITGLDWTPLLDEEYIAVWLDYASRVRTIGARTWIRRHLSRMMGWVFYRVIYGWVTPEDLSEFIDKISTIEVPVAEGKEVIKILCPEEIAYFKTVAQAIAGVVARELVPSPSTLATLSEYMVIGKDIVDKVLAHYKVPSDYLNLYRTYIKLRPIKSDFKTLLNRARTALVRDAISEDDWKRYLGRAKDYGFTDEEIKIQEEIAELDEKIAESRTWSPTLLTLISISEVVPEAIELLKYYPVDERFKPVVSIYAERRPLIDEIRQLISRYYRAKRYAELQGQTIPKEIEDIVKDYMKLGGVTEIEEKLRDLSVRLDVLVDSWREVLPSLSQLATMAEYIEISPDYITSVITRRRVEAQFGEYWMKYIQARSISTEVNRVVSAFEALFIRYAVPSDLVNTIKALMSKGGWTSAELSILDFELYLRKVYRIFIVLIPTLRQFIVDSAYMPNYLKLIDDLIITYGIPADVFKAQIEYYKSLAKNRRIWRHFAWYRTQLTYAYQYGAIDKDKAKQLLKKFVDAGIIDEDEVNIILEGMDLRAVGYAARR